MTDRSSTDWPTVLRALEIARNTGDGTLPPEIATILEHAIVGIWRRIQNQPDAYILTPSEYTVFNYFQARFQGNPTAQRARARYWNNISHRTSNGPC